MSRACCVLFCSSGNKVPSHHFPSNLVLFKLWKNAVFSKKVEHLSDEQLRKCVVCHKHFKEDDYSFTRVRRTLNKNAVPCINIPISEAYLSTFQVQLTEESSEACPSTSQVQPMEKSSKTYPSTSQVQPTEESSEACPSTSQVQPMKESSEACPTSQIQPMEESSETCPNTSQVQSMEENSKACPSTSGLQEKNVGDLKSVRSRNRISRILPASTKSLQLSSKSKHIYSIAKKVQKKLYVMQKKNLVYKKRLEAAERCKNSAVTQELLQTLTEAQQNFIGMQIKAAKYKPQGQRFTLDEKILALSIWKKSEKCYKFLRQLFNLPSISTLQNLLQRMYTAPGPMNIIKNE